MDTQIFREKLTETRNFWGRDIRDSDICEFYNHFDQEFSEEFSLFRYRPADYMNIISLTNQTLFLSPNGRMNDVFEGIPKSTPFEKYVKHKKKLDDLVIMACFSENNNDPVMWGNYADSFQGMCVEYDITKLFNSRNEHRKHIFPVIYENRRPFEHDIDDIARDMVEICHNIEHNEVHDGDSLLNILPLFLTKSKNWAYEREWRLIYTKYQQYNADDENLYKGMIDFPFVKAVYLGVRMDPRIKADIFKRINDLNKESNTQITVYDSKFKEDGYELDFSRMKDPTNERRTI